MTEGRIPLWTISARADGDSPSVLLFTPKNSVPHRAREGRPMHWEYAFPAEVNAISLRLVGIPKRMGKAPEGKKDDPAVPIVSAKEEDRNSGDDADLMLEISEEPN